MKYFIVICSFISAHSYQQKKVVKVAIKYHQAFISFVKRGMKYNYTFKSKH